MFCAFNIFENLEAFHLQQGKGGLFLMDWLEEHTQSPVFSGERIRYNFLFFLFYFFFTCAVTDGRRKPWKSVNCSFFFFLFKWFGGSGDPLIKESVSELGIWPLPL